MGTPAKDSGSESNEDPDERLGGEAQV